MAYANLTTWAEVLKTFYLPAIQDQLNRDTILSDMIDVNEEDVSGKNATIECHYGRNTGTGARADGGTLPTATYQKFKTCTVPMKYNYGRVSFTGPTIAATRDAKGAYARVMDTEIRGVVDDLQKEVNRQLWGAGYGMLGRWYESNSGVSYDIQADYRGFTAAQSGDRFGSTFGAKYLEENNSAVPVVLSSMGASTGTYTVDTTDIAVSAWTWATGSTKYDVITCTNPGVSEAAGTFYVRPGSLGAATTNGGQRLEMMGLRGIVDKLPLDDINIYDGTNDRLATANVDYLQGLNCETTYTWFAANVDQHASGRYAGQRAITDKLLQAMFDKIEKKAGKDYGPNMAITTRAIRREILTLWKTDRRFVNTMEFDGGWKGLEYNGIPIFVDNDAIDGEIYFLTTKDLQIYRMSDYDWMDRDGAILFRLTGYDAYEAVLFRYAELGVKRRNTQGVIADLSYDRDLH